MDLVYTKLHRVNPNLPSQQLLDCTQQKESQSGERELEKNKPQKSLPKLQEEEQKSINYVKTISAVDLLNQIFFMQKCSGLLDRYSTKSTISTVWRHHYGATFYKSLEQLTVSQNSKVNLVS